MLQGAGVGFYDVDGYGLLFVCLGDEDDGDEVGEGVAKGYWGRLQRQS